MPLPLRRLTAFVLLGLVLAGAAVFATGRVALEVTTGSSMEPTHHAGDLAVVVPAGSYQTGDIVAYRGGPDLVVLHRIIGGDAESGFTFKGDNNQSVDPSHPSGDQLIGREILAIPGIGGILSSLVVRGLLIVAALALLGTLMLKPKRDTEPLRSVPGIHEVPVERAPRRPALIALVVADALLLVGVIFAFALPTPKPAATAPSPTQTGTLAYGTAVPASETYPTGEIVTGDPVFTKLVNSLPVSFHYDTQAPPATVNGSVQLDAELSTQSGWHSTLPLAPPTPIANGAVNLTGTLDLGVVRDLADRVSQSTGLNNQQVDVAVKATGDITLAGHDPVAYEAELPFKLSTLSLTYSGPAPTPSDHGPVVSKTTPIDDSKPAKPAPADGRKPLSYGLLAALVLASGTTVVLWPSKDDEEVLERLTLTPTDALDLEPGDVTRIRLADRRALDTLAAKIGSPVMRFGETMLVVVAPDALYWVDATDMAESALERYADHQPDNRDEPDERDEPDHVDEVDERLVASTGSAFEAAVTLTRTAPRPGRPRVTPSPVSMKAFAAISTPTDRSRQWRRPPSSSAS
jgi:signal peptidase I